MADSKISGLTSISGSNTASDDLFHIVDVSVAAESQNKSITRDELINAVTSHVFSGPTNYTPTTQGLGTLASTQYYYMVFNDTLMFVSGRHVNGTVTGDEAQIGLPSGYQLHTSAYASITYITRYQRNAYTTARYHLLATGGDSYFNIARGDASGGATAFTPMNGNQGLGSDEIQSFQAWVFVETV